MGHRSQVTGRDSQVTGLGSRLTGHRAQVANNICKLIMSFQKNRFHNYDLKSEITGQSGKWTSGCLIPEGKLFLRRLPPLSGHLMSRS